MSKAQTCRYTVHITGAMVYLDAKLRVDIDVETGPLHQSKVFSRDATQWDEALELVKKHAARRVPLRFRVLYETPHWDLLPPCLEFTKFSTIDTLTVKHYPHLTHIDVTALPFLRRFHWYPIGNELDRVDEKEYALTSIRITGLTQCKYLEDLCLQGMLYHPFILKLKAPFRNLQALEELNVEFKCVNRRYPLELAASQSLCELMYNGRSVLPVFKAFRSIVQCACIAMYHLPKTKATAFAKAMACGPIHNPSLIVDVAAVIRRQMERNSTPIAHTAIDALMKPM